MHSEIRVGFLIRFGLVVFAAWTVALVVWACLDSEIFFAAAGSVAILLAAGPIGFRQKYDLFSPWSFVLLALLFGCTLQSYCISWRWPSADYIEEAMLLGHAPNYFVGPALIFLLGVAALTAGYFLSGQASSVRLGLNRHYHPVNLILILGGCLLVSAVASFLFVRATGGFQSGRISDKRTVIRTVDVAEDEDFQQYGHYRQLAKLSTVAFLVLYSFALSHAKRRLGVGKLNLGFRVLLVLVFLLACAVPFYSSSRAQICWLILGALGVSYYHNFSAATALRMSLLCGLGVVVFLLMSFLRHADTADLSERISSNDALRSLLLNRNGPGLTKTAHIIQHVPEPLSYQYGKTIAIWAIAPIPRRIFPGKPLVHSGPIIGTTIYGTKVSGVPPGLIAELYWNFSWPGVFVGMFVTGWLLGRVYRWFCASSIDPGLTVPVYLFAVIPVGFSVLGHSLGYGVIMRLVDFVTIAAVVWACTRFGVGDSASEGD